MDYVLKNDLVERGWHELAYVGKLGRNDIDVYFTRGKKDCACGYHMIYAR